MQTSSSASIPSRTPLAPSAEFGSVVGYIYFSFICYLSIGLPLAVLPAFVHLRMGMHAALAGLVISIQYIATFLSRPWAGRISDHAGAKISVLWGMAACTLSGLLLLAAVALHFSPSLTLAALISSRLALGVGESLGSTGATLWGISSTGPEHTAKVISFNGVATYGGLALGAPLGVILDQQWGLTSLGLLTTLLCAISFAVAMRKNPAPVNPVSIYPSAMCLAALLLTE
jgi:MFS family permease